MSGFAAGLKREPSTQRAMSGPILLHGRSVDLLPASTVPSFRGLAGIVLAAAMLTHAVSAQKSEHPTTLALVLLPVPPSSGGVDSVIASFERAMTRLGYIEGRDVRYEVRTRRLGDTTQLSATISDLARSDPRVIVAGGSTEALLAASLLPSTPVVAWSGNPESEGLVRSPARPEGTVTGFTSEPRWFADFFAALPHMRADIKDIALVYDSTYRPQRGNLVIMRRVVDSLGLRAHVYSAHSEAEIAAALDSAAASRAQAIFLLSPRFRVTARRWVSAALRDGMIPLSTYDEVVDGGGLYACPPDFRRWAELAATYVDRILKGARVADLPVQESVPHVCSVNMKLSDSLGLRIPDDLRARSVRFLR